MMTRFLLLLSTPIWPFLMAVLQSKSRNYSPGPVKPEDLHISVFSHSVKSETVCVQVTGDPWTQNAIQRLSCLWNLASPSRSFFFF